MCVCVCVCSVYIYIYIHSCVCEHLGCFHVLTIVNSAIMNLGVHVSFQITFMSVYMLRSGITGSYGNFALSFLRELHTVLHSDAPAVSEGPLLPVPSPALILCGLCDDVHSDHIMHLE